MSLSKLARRSGIEIWGPRSAAALTALMGVVNVLSAVRPALAERLAVLEQLSPLEVHNGSRLTAALAGFALLSLARSLWRHKSTAWLIAMVVLAVSAVSHLLKGLDYEESILAAALAAWLWFLRHHFPARSDRASVAQGARVLIGALLFTLAYGVIGFYWLDRHFSVNFDLLPALRQTVIMFTQFYDPGLEPITRFGRYFADSIYFVGAATIGYALVMLARPVLIREAASPAERSRAASIVAAHGRSSLARFTLFDDKAYYFSPGGSMVAFVAKGRVAVALGDPVGPEADLPAAITGFKEHCAPNDWGPAFYQTQADTLEHYKAAGFDALCIGHEGVVDLAAFTTEGKANKTLRTSVNHVAKLGYHAEAYSPPIADRVLDELGAIGDEWLAMMGGGEKRFSVGWFDDAYVRECTVIAVHAPDGGITAFANLLPKYQRNEATVDMMRRKREVENGTMDFLFVSLFQWAKANGYTTFNLGLSALSGVGEHSEDPATEKALHYIYEHVNRFYNFKGLHAFKEKFHPEWSPRYLVYPGPASLPAVLGALIRADSGDDFVWEYLRNFRR